MADGEIVWADAPALTADGVETIARCSRCGAPYVPKSAAHRFCADACRDAAKTSTDTWRSAQAARSERAYALNVSYRLARRVIRRRGIDPATVPALEALRGQGVVEGWRALVGLLERDGTAESPTPGRRSLAADPERPWRATIGEQPTHLRPRGMELHFDPPLHASPRYAAEGLRRHLHAMVTGLVARDHHGYLPAWALVPLAPSGWGVLLYDPADAERLRGVAHEARVGGWRGTVTLGPAMSSPRTPAALAPGRYVVTLDTITPAHHVSAGRTRAVTQPGVETVLSALSLALQMAGVSPAGRQHVEAVACDAQPERVTIGGHSGAVAGWVGRLTIECNAPAAWALQIAAIVGFGGKCAFGLGRVRVRVVAQ